MPAPDAHSNHQPDQPDQLADRERGAHGHAPGVPQPEAELSELQRLIGESAAQSGGIEWLQPGDFTRVRELVQERRGAAFSADPIATDLVAAVLEGYFAPAGGAPAHGWRALAGPVADSLCANPATSARLEQLWQRLQESAA